MKSAWLSKIKAYLLKVAITEAVLICGAIIYWFVFAERTFASLLVCLLVTGILFVAIGSFIYVSAHRSTITEANRKAFYRGDANPTEATARAWSDADESYSVGGLLLWAGFAAIGITFLVRGFA
jgi:hypothetical protein